MCQEQPTQLVPSTGNAACGRRIRLVLVGPTRVVLGQVRGSDSN
jgi:hypothetical protein